jgi:putative nucleotidyltransferase with HDIG domain
MEDRLESILSRIEELPTLPVVSQRILELMADEDASNRDIALLVENDQSLALKIMKLANSAFFGSLTKIASLEQAMIKLGMNEVRSIVLAVSVYDFFSNSDSGIFDRKRFWKHGIVCSHTAKYLGASYRTENDTLFISGLVHDMGKAVLDEFFHDEFLSIINYLELKKCTFSEAEKAVIGLTHSQIAAKLLNQWKFPDIIVQQILYHHSPWEDKNNEKGSIMIYLADIITKAAGYYCHADEEAMDLKGFSQSERARYISSKGFKLDYEDMERHVKHIIESIAGEADSMMRFFE